MELGNSIFQNQSIIYHNHKFQFLNYTCICFQENTKKKNLIKIYQITCFEKQSHLKNDTLIAINHK